MNTQPLPTIRVFAPEQWGEIDKFANFYSGSYKFSDREKRAVAGVLNHFQKAITLQTLAVKLKPGLDIEKKQLEERGYTPALNSHELSAVIEASILELDSSLDCTVKVLRAVYGGSSRSFPESTRRLPNSMVIKKQPRLVCSSAVSGRAAASIVDFRFSRQRKNYAAQSLAAPRCDERQRGHYQRVR
jgi:hypothetical protein